MNEGQLKRRFIWIHLFNSIQMHIDKPIYFVRSLRYALTMSSASVSNNYKAIKGF